MFQLNLRVSKNTKRKMEEMAEFTEMTKQEITKMAIEHMYWHFTRVSSEREGGKGERRLQAKTINLTV